MESDWRPVIEKIDDIIAEDTWKNEKGDQRNLIVGRPKIIPVDLGKSNPTWYCPVQIEGVTNGVRPVFGQGPVDSLMNAMAVVRSFFDSFYGAAWRDPGS